MEVSRRSDRLPCGTQFGLLVDQVAENLPPADPAHQGGCGHCQAALAELEPLWAQVRELAREEVSVSATLVDTVMRAVRQQRRDEQAGVPLDDVVPRLVNHALLLDERGTTKIADSVIARIAGREALATPGVRGLDRAGVTVELEGHRVSAHLRLVVDFGYVIPDVVAAVRERVADAIRSMMGLETAAIDITVAKVAEEDA